MSVKLIIFILSFALYLAAGPVIILAQPAATPSGTVQKVDHIANIRERLIERINVFFKFNPTEKAQYQKELAEKRLGELVYVIESDRGDMLEEASTRYAAYLGRVTDYVLENKLDNKKVELIDMLNNHKKVLEPLVQKMEYESGFWLLLKHDINTVSIFQQKLNGT